MIIAAIARHRRELFWGQYALLTNSLSAAVRVGATKAMLDGGLVKELLMTLELYRRWPPLTADIIAEWDRNKVRNRRTCRGRGRRRGKKKAMLNTTHSLSLLYQHLEFILI